MRTLERLAGVSGLEVEVRLAPRMTREERRSLRLHRAIARKLEDEPQAVLGKARRVLSLMMAKHPHAAPLLREWRVLLALSVEDLSEILTDIRPHARELRQVTPFAGALTARERAEVYRSFGISSAGEEP
jgi:hypothetical protein